LPLATPAHISPPVSHPRPARWTRTRGAAVARRLRADLTPAERRLWQGIRAHRLDGLHFRRQVEISPYVVDFACTSARLVIELDGAAHDHELDQVRDEARDAELRARGYRVIRFENREVMEQGDAVIESIRQAIRSG